MYTERQSRALFCWYGCFFRFPSPLLWLLLQRPPPGTKEPLRERPGGGQAAADAGHLYTDQARYHEVGAAEPPIAEATLERTEELLGGGFNLRGSLGVGSFLNFSTGNYIKYGWGGCLPVWKKPGLLDSLLILLCLVVSDRMPT